MGLKTRLVTPGRRLLIEALQALREGLAPPRRPEHPERGPPAAPPRPALGRCWEELGADGRMDLGLGMLGDETIGH